MKHQNIEDALEEYLMGTLEGLRLEQFERALAEDPDLREQVEAMSAQAEMFALLRAGDDAPAPRPGFYARLADRIEAEERSVWALFFQPEWARRMAFASLILLAVLGSFLVTRESELAAYPSPEMILAAEHQQDFPRPAHDESRNRMLLTLASFE